MNRYVLFYNDISENTQPFNIFAWMGFMIRNTAIITKEGKDHALKQRVFLDYVEKQGIGHHFAYEQAEWMWQPREGEPKRYQRTIAFLCVPDDSDAVLLRMRFDCLPTPEDQDIRGPWYPRAAYATVELDD